MSILDIDIDNYSQILISSKTNKEQYGEINTPFSLISKMLNLIPDNEYKDPYKKWLDPGTGQGYFMIALFFKLFHGLSEVFFDVEERKQHIIENMLYMCEINPEHITHLWSVFGENANITIGDYIQDMSSNEPLFDVIVGNPPYHCKGIKKVPTNFVKNKKQDGTTAWIEFVDHSIHLLKPNGYLCFITPSIWMKPDRARRKWLPHLYNYFLQYRIHKIHCMTNTETNRIFKKQAQTPTCWFLLQKTLVDKQSISLYDNDCKRYINFPIYSIPQLSIPLSGSSLISKLIPFVEKAGFIKVLKTNMPPTNTKTSFISDEIHPYTNISTCILDSDKVTPKLIFSHTNVKQAYYGVPKLIMAHKMYGFPVIDSSGVYGISTRDNYVIVDKTQAEFEKLHAFLSTNFARYVFEAARYRMKYLEKHAFQWLPDITHPLFNDFTCNITDETISNYFDFSSEERKAIKNLHKKIYKIIK